MGAVKDWLFGEAEIALNVLNSMGIESNDTDTVNWFFEHKLWQLMDDAEKDGTAYEFENAGIKTGALAGVIIKHYVDYDKPLGSYVDD